MKEIRYATVACQEAFWILHFNDSILARKFPFAYQRGGANHDVKISELHSTICYEHSPQHTISQNPPSFLFFMGLWERCLRFFGHCTVATVLHHCTPQSNPRHRFQQSKAKRRFSNAMLSSSMNVAKNLGFVPWLHAPRVGKCISSETVEVPQESF